MVYSQELKGSHMENGHKETRAIRKLQKMLDEKKESVASLAEKLGCARGTLLGILAGRTEPRLNVMQSAKKVGVDIDDWGRS